MENKEILDLIYKMFPNPHCELEYFDDFSFLCAVVLSAQTTDKRVNIVTKELFNKYKTLEELKKADVKDFENIVGFGIVGTIDNKKIILGNRKIIEKFSIKNNHLEDEKILALNGNSIVYIANEKEIFSSVISRSYGSWGNSMWKQ